MMIQHKIVACRCRRKSVEKTCEKIGLTNYRYRGDFFSRFLYFFKRHYLIFTRSADAAQSDMLPDAPEVSENPAKILGIAGFVFSLLGMLFIVGMPLSIVSLKKFGDQKKAGSPVNGKGLAIAGVAISCFWIAYWIFFIVFMTVMTNIM